MSWAEAARQEAEHSWTFKNCSRSRPKAHLKAAFNVKKERCREELELVDSHPTVACCCLAKHSAVLSRVQACFPLLAL